jgi:hypothetical protein
VHKHSSTQSYTIRATCHGTSINKVSRSLECERNDCIVQYIQLHELERFQVKPKNGFADYNDQGYDQPTLFRDEIEGEHTPFAIIWAVFALSMTAV